jgi:hypothetical protein
MAPARGDLDGMARMRRAGAWTDESISSSKSDPSVNATAFAPSSVPRLTGGSRIPQVDDRDASGLVGGRASRQGARFAICDTGAQILVRARGAPKVGMVKTQIHERGQEAWQELAATTPLAAVLDLDHTCVPLSTSSDNGLDRSLLLLLDALHVAEVQVAIITRRPEPLVERMKAQTPHAWWFADVEVALSEVRKRRPGVRIVAIGDDDAFRDLQLGDDLAFGVRSAESGATTARMILRGPAAVRAILWWLVSLRSGLDAMERRG